MPLEVKAEIGRHAWASIGAMESWGDRWDFFRSMSLVSHAWRGIMVTVALRRVTIQSARDFAVYRFLVKSEFGVDPDSKDVERVHPSAHAFFQASTIHIVLTDWSCPGLSGFIFSTDYARIPCYIPTCRYIAVLVKELPSNDRYVLPYRPLFQFLTQYHATKRLFLSWTYQHINRYILPQDHVHGVTYLRLHDYPRCVCHNIGVRNRHKPDCFSFYLPTLFPDLRHLHIDTPILLKGISTLAQVTLLTIEAPPIFYLPDLGYYSALWGWNIVSAVANGLLRRDGQDAPKKKIVVNAGVHQPAGWREALAACNARDVTLRLRHVYSDPANEGTVTTIACDDDSDDDVEATGEPGPEQLV